MGIYQGSRLRTAENGLGLTGADMLDLLKNTCIYWLPAGETHQTCR